MRLIAQSLSAKLLVLAIAYVMLSEVLIFAPSISRFRLTYLEDRLAAAHIAALVLQTGDDETREGAVVSELLRHAKAEAIVLQQDDRRTLLMLLGETPAMPKEFVDLRRMRPIGNIVDALQVLLRPEPRTIRVIGESPMEMDVVVEIVFDETPLKQEMIGFSIRILGLSIIISLVTATLIYVTLQGLMVRAMRRLTQSMISFRDNPEDPAQVIVPSGRADEIGVAETVLAEMQRGLRDALVQRERLATLGTAVGKINHDLRNALATVQLISDGLAESRDPQVRKVMPRLIGAIDRAVNLCAQTLEFAREGAPPLHREEFDLAPLAQEVWTTLADSLPAEVRMEVTTDLRLSADRDQLFRVLNNLVSNAVEAGARHIELDGVAERDRAVITVRDDGPGIPDDIRATLFQPFRGTGRPGGTGLGLAIARELVKAHGGDLVLAESGGDGTTFRLDLPRAVVLAAA